MATAEPSAPPLPEEFASAEALLAAFVRDSGGNISFVDNGQRVRFATERFATWLGRPLDQVLGRTLRELYGPEVHDRIDPSLRRALAGETVRYEREARHAGGESHWISVVLTPTRDAAGRVLGFFSSALEVEELMRTHDALGHALEEIATHIENSPLAVIEWSARLRVKRWSPQAETIFGWKLDEVLGKEAVEFSLIHPASLEIAQVLAEQLLKARATRNRALVRNITRDGRVIWCEWYNSAFFDAAGRLASILSFAEDVTARVEAEEQLQKLAVNDALTGLPNRNSLATLLEHAIRRVTRSGDRIALLFIDLDRFKRVNDTLGHAAGDEVLRQAGARIRACVREVDTVARLGGDEFVVLLETDVRPDTPGIIGERVRAAFATPFEWKGTEVRCGASVGVSLYPDHARDAAALLASADEAMYRAKREPQT
jgi:diguanylate cyclase (GGDEF)-like protein/PAS domain S-box-containing protein